MITHQKFHSAEDVGDLFRAGEQLIGAAYMASPSGHEAEEPVTGPVLIGAYTERIVARALAWADGRPGHTAVVAGVLGTAKDVSRLQVKTSRRGELVITSSPGQHLTDDRLTELGMRRTTDTESWDGHTYRRWQYGAPGPGTSREGVLTVCVRRRPPRP